MTNPQAISKEAKAALVAMVETDLSAWQKTAADPDPFIADIGREMVELYIDIIASCRRSEGSA